LGEGIVSSFPVALNLFLKRIGEQPFWKHGRNPTGCDRGRNGPASSSGVRRAHAHRGARGPARSSGGHIQKVLLARELSFDPKVVVFNKPTYGLDVKTTASVRDVIRRLVAGGAPRS
jgi:simple sugar transport system ATP-binding protein